MRLSRLLVFSMILAGMTLPVCAETASVKGAIKGTATVGKGVVQGAGQAGRL